MKSQKKLFLPSSSYFISHPLALIAFIYPDIPLETAFNTNYFRQRVITFLSQQLQSHTSFKCRARENPPTALGARFSTSLAHTCVFLNVTCLDTSLDCIPDPMHRLRNNVGDSIQTFISIPQQIDTLC